MNDITRLAMVDPKRILVMDDTATVADLIREMLLSMGHQVELSQTVEEAMAMFEPGRFDLVITDYTMPRMNGMEFAHVLRQRAPEQLILLITGSTFSLQQSMSPQMPINGVLQKPFSVDEFQRAVMEMLSASQSSIFTITQPQTLPREIEHRVPRVLD